MVDASLLVVTSLLGLLSTFSPCLFPLLPSYVAMSYRNKGSKLTIFLSSLALILGLMIVFLILGSLGSVFGSFLVSNYVLFARIQGTILILAGLIMIRTPNFIYRIKIPDTLNKWILDDGIGAEKTNLYRSLLYSFLLGLVFTIIAAPCAAGYFLTVWASLLDKTFIEQILIVLVFGFSIGLPFMIMGLFMPEVSPETVNKLHSATSKISMFLGIILIIVGVLLLAEVSPLEIPVGL